MAYKTTTLTVQKWGNSLAVRIPATFAKSAHFHIGTAVELILQGNTIIVKSTGKQKFTLAERIALFDPQKHGGEVMADEPIGLEKLK